MATKDGNQIVWTTNDLAALINEKERLQDLIDEIQNSVDHVAFSAYQDACAALAWQDLGSPEDLNTTLQAAPRGKAPAKGKKRPKR